MLRKISRYLSPRIAVEFSSDFLLPESIDRLRKATSRHPLASFAEQFAAGPVSASMVRLQRVVPFFGNSFKPVFVGRFVERERRVLLEGHFTVFRKTALFVLLMLGFLSLLTVVMTAMLLISTSPRDRYAPLLPVGFGILIVALVRFGWWLSRRDLDFLEAVIRTALTRPHS